MAFQIIWFIFSLAQVYLLLTRLKGIPTCASQAYDSGRLSIYSYIKKLDDAANLSHAIEAFQILVYLDIIISWIFMYIQIQGRKLTDPVVSRILFWTTPFFVILLISGLVLEIIPSTMTDYNPLAYNLASIMIEGFCSVGITAVIISTMNIAGVQWTKAPGPVTAPPMNQAGYPTNNGQPQPTWQPGMQPPQYQQGWQPQQQQTPYGSPPAGWQPQQQSTPYQIWNSQPAPNWQQPQQQPPPNMQYNPYSQPQTPPQQQQQQGYPQQQPQSMYGSPAPATYHTPSPGAPPPTHP
ncbi:hypothetical protein CPB86DRAFT_782229 [Serendipita vermifera]|nr:hypothetical protein CPB86DRAFT_782229 [Serendipita vermifera]